MVSIGLSAGDNADATSPQAGAGPGFPLRRRSLALLGSSSLLVLVGVGGVAPTPARAACTTTADCYGELATRGIVTYNPDGSVNQVATGGAGGGINETVPSAVSGNQTGILAVNANDGAIALTANDAVTGIDGYGIVAINAQGVTFDANGRLTAASPGTGTDVIVKANAAVTAGTEGIVVGNYGTGRTQVTAGDVTVTGFSGFGIDVVNDNSTTSLTIDVGTVDGGGIGIRGIARGTGDTSITARGTVTASNTGIWAENRINTGKLTVEAMDAVSGGSYGIFAYSEGTGVTSVTAAGPVTAMSTGGTGILARSQNNDVTVNAASVSGADIGVSAYSAGGVTSVTTTGDVSGITGYGIIANNYLGTGLTVNAAAVNGGHDGIAAFNSGNGAARITATGAVTGMDGYGVLTVNGDVVMNPAGMVTKVTGPKGTDLTVEAAAVSGKYDGILAVNTGSGNTSVHASGDVEGAGAGIMAIAARQVTFNPTTGAVGTITAGTGADLAVTADAKVSGGDFGILAYNAGTGSTSVTAKGDVTSTSGFGIYASNNSTNGLTVSATSVSGGTYGIYANGLLGSTSVTATGTVTGVIESGIYATTDGADLTVNAASVIGGKYGIRASNLGGSTSVTATGNITGMGEDGVYASTFGTDLAVKAARVSGGDTGIRAYNFGTGATKVTAADAVTGTDGYGVVAVNAQSIGSVPDGPVTQITGPKGTDLTVETAGVSGKYDGILAVNTGSGETSIHASGDVEGTAGTGIMAVVAGSASFTNDGSLAGTMAGTGTDLTVTADARVTGASNGIRAANAGTGSTSVTTTGNVTGTSEMGIVATTSGKDVTVKAATVSGGTYGIYAFNSGIGLTSVTATGVVTGANNIGIIAGNTSTAKDVTVEAATVSGMLSGIYAWNEGTGSTSVTATGDVTTTYGFGIYAENESSAQDITINAARVSGETYGIYAFNKGTGATSVTVNGAVEGGTAGLFLRGAAPAMVTIAASGTLRNASGLAGDLALLADGTKANLTVEGRMTGTLAFQGSFDDQATIKGAWITSSVSDFGAGNDTLTVATSGTLRAINTIRFDNLEAFINNGLVTMQDGVVGNRIATAANVTLAAGSTLAIEINAAGTADGIDTAGTANISGSTLNVAPQGIKLGRYTVVTAAGGMTGTFGAVTGPTLAFLGFIDGYNATDAYLDVLKVRNFADAALTPNQRAAAGGIESVLSGNPLYDAVLMLPTDAAARAAFDQASGEVHASAKTALIDDSRFVREAVNTRIRAAFDGIGASSMPVMAYGDGGPQFVPATTDRFAVWGQGFGSWGDTSGDGNAAHLNRSTSGFFLGADAPAFDTWRLGMIAGYSRTSFDVKDRRSLGSSNNYHLGLYGGTTWGSLAFRTGAAYTWHDVTTSRSVSFPGFSDALKGDYHAGTAQVFGELGYGMTMGAARFEPFASLAYVNVHAGDFTEQGGAAALTSQSSNTDATFTTLGLRASTSFDVGGAPLTAKGTLGWRHAFGDVTPLSTMRFASGGDAFSIGGVPIARDAAVVEAGLDFNLAPAAVFGVSYAGQFGSGVTDQTFRANFNVKF